MFSRATRLILIVISVAVGAFLLALQGKQEEQARAHLLAAARLPLRLPEEKAFVQALLAALALDAGDAEQARNRLANARSLARNAQIDAVIAQVEGRIEGTGRG